jgi:hypothetical protein
MSQGLGVAGGCAVAAFVPRTFVDAGGSLFGANDRVFTAMMDAGGAEMLAHGLTVQTTKRLLLTAGRVTELQGKLSVTTASSG